MDKALCNRFRNAALLSAFMVVVIHCISTFKAESRLLWAFGYDGILRTAVPFFFLVSGFFVGRHVGEPGWWRRETVKRCRSLLIPAAFWLTVYFAYRNTFLFASGGNLDLMPAHLLEAMGLNPFEYPCLRPLWYVRALFCLVLASPLVACMVRRCGAAPILLLLPFGAAFFFPLGLAFGMGVVDLRISRGRAVVFVIAGCALLPLDVWCHLSDLPLGHRVGLSLPFLVLGMANLMPSVRLPHLVATAAFPIFLTHMFAVSALGVVIRRQGWSRIVSEPVVLLGIALAVFLVVMTVTTLLRWSFPALKGVLWGGR